MDLKPVQNAKRFTLLQETIFGPTKEIKIFLGMNVKTVLLNKGVMKWILKKK